MVLSRGRKIFGFRGTTPPLSPYKTNAHFTPGVGGAPRGGGPPRCAGRLPDPAWRPAASARGSGGRCSAEKGAVSSPWQIPVRSIIPQRPQMHR